VSTAVDSLLGQSKCQLCFTGADTADLLELELWTQVANARGIMNTDPQSLLESAQCYVCQGVSLFQALKLSLLAQISLNHNPANKVDPQSLMAQAACLNCYANTSIGRLMELALLAQIAS